MIDAPQITRTRYRLTAVIPLVIPHAQIRDVMEPGVGELMSAVARQGIAPVGPWFTHHLRMDPDFLHFEIGIPVAARIEPEGRVKPAEWPAMKVARTIHLGPYEGLPTAWGEFDAWIRAEGLEPAPDLWECYRDGPESNRNPATWRTELNRPLLGD